jgi:type II secretory ATPase GspE/PulE/Tfp pilus assembly ATPase PilB-like protein
MSAIFKRTLARMPLEIRTQGELDQLTPPMLRTLGKDLEVLSLVARMCPVLFADGTTGVFVLSEFYHDDQTAALVQLLKKRNFRLNSTPVFVLSPALLIAVTKAVRPSLTSSAQSPEPVAQGGALVQAMNAILVWAFRHRASDVHFNVKRVQRDSTVMFTIDGRYVCPDRYAHLPTATMLAMLAVTWMDVEGGNGAVFDPTVEQQGRVTRELDGQRVCLRWASLATDQGCSVCLRLLVLDSTDLTPELSELGYLASQVAALRKASLMQGGAIVLAGTVGSGKSTTLATLMREIPAYRKIITLEDPAEYFIPNALQNTVSRSFEDNELSVFDNKLKAFKRSAMNDLLIGEIRDAAGGRAFSDLAGSGVSLYTTVHAGSALWVPERLSSSFIGVPRDLLATPGILKLLVFQCLLPLLCQGCAQTYEQRASSGHWHCALSQTRSAQWRERWIAALEEQADLPRSRLRFRSEQGCPKCANGLSALIGTSGRTVAAEMIVPSEEPDFLKDLKANDGLRMHRWFEHRQRSALSDADMRGKSASQCALFKVWNGLVDPRTVEQVFGVSNLVMRSPLDAL